MDLLGIGFLQDGWDVTLGGGLEGEGLWRPNRGALTLVQQELQMTLS